ncbi:beta-glucuronosyltransferase GlcAT14A-like [Phoenix dactylifera]|uniref:Beta-glucuronosyltransferase GlcAT14A-like n=1 Tax=Phoenix dactylifera TaxID=42345 RepID=A0A8B7D254_PHODC|nr:beta-glucuronosyltransferase GlcAT14A-like [Phoenix dactylifera]
MRQLRFSPWIGIAAFVVGALALRVLSHSLLRGGIPAADQGFRPVALSRGPGDPPVFAYWMSGTGGEGEKILRLLKAVYHPRNSYLLHLDADSTAGERRRLALAIQSDRIFKAFANVEVVGKPHAVDRTGSSVLAAAVNGAAVLLKISSDWDWFINLSASDYPVVTQDDLLHAFTSLPRDLNFIDHTSDLGWKESERFDKIIVDPSLHMDKNTESFFASETRATPDAFTLFTGSPWFILSRPFVEHCVHSWDNFPRKLLMYFANVAYSMESYFQTVICNSPEFRNTTVNSDLRYFLWDDPPGLDPRFLNQSQYKEMIKSGAAFARRFMEDDSVLEKIDKKILRRSPNGVGVGKWCLGRPGGRKRKELEEDPCSSWGDINVVVPGPSGKRLRSLVSGLISDEKLRSNQCRFA